MTNHFNFFNLKPVCFSFTVCVAMLATLAQAGESACSSNEVPETASCFQMTHDAFAKSMVILGGRFSRSKECQFIAEVVENDNLTLLSVDKMGASMKLFIPHNSRPIMITTPGPGSTRRQQRAESVSKTDYLVNNVRVLQLTVQAIDLNYYGTVSLFNKTGEKVSCTSKIGARSGNY